MRIFTATRVMQKLRPRRGNYEIITKIIGFKRGEIKIQEHAHSWMLRDVASRKQ